MGKVVFLVVSCIYLLHRWGLIPNRYKHSLPCEDDKRCEPDSFDNCDDGKVHTFPVRRFTTAASKDKWFCEELERCMRAFPKL